MLSNRHFFGTDKKPRASDFVNTKKTLQVSAVMIGTNEIYVVLMDWERVEGQAELQKSFSLVRHLFPTKNFVIMSRDPYKYGQPTVFFGQPDVVRLFDGRRVDDLRWTPVEYKMG